MTPIITPAKHWLNNTPELSAEEPPGEISYLAFSADGTALLAVSGVNYSAAGIELILWDIQQEQRIRVIERNVYFWGSTFFDHGHGIIGFSGSASHLYYLSNPGITGQTTASFWHHPGVFERKIVPLPANQTHRYPLADSKLSNKEDTPRIWEGQAAIRAGAIDPHTGCFATLLSNGYVCLWVLPSSAYIGGFLAHPNQQDIPEGSITFDPSGKYLATTGFDNSVHLWTVAEQQLVRTISHDRCRITRALWHPDGVHLLTTGKAADYRDIDMWNTQTGEHIFRIEGEHVCHNGEDVVFHPRGTYIAIIGELNEETVSDRVLIYELRNRTIAGRLVIPNDQDRFAEPTSIAWSPDGQWVVRGDEEGALWFWAVAV